MCTATHFKTAQEQSKDHDKELEVPTWPQNAPDPNLIELQEVGLKHFDPWSAVGKRGAYFT